MLKLIVLVVTILLLSTHVLLSEIGADLKKKFDDERNPEEVVSLLSNRMHGLYRFNTNWYNTT